MIRINVPGFFPGDKGGPRWGDCTIIDDGKNYVVIDGYCGVGADRLIKRLKKLGIKSPWLYLSHYHYDHYNGLERIIDDPWFTPKGFRLYNPGTLNAGKQVNSEIRSDVADVKRIIDKAKAKGIPIRYLKDGQTIKHGAIKFQVYREQPSTLNNSSDPHGWAYNNDGSLVFYFTALRYLTSGDGSKRIYDLCKSRGIAPVFFKVPHHGNNCPQSQAEGLKSLGALYCWDNDYSTTITDFLSYGRKRCIEAGIKYFSCHDDINLVAANKKAYIYKDGQHYQYACGYSGKAGLKKADDDIVQKVISGELGTNDTRVTNLLDLGYWPSQVQKSVNKKLSGKAGENDSILELVGVDVSYAQGQIDWDKAANEIDFAIIQCGYGQNRTDQDDKQFKRNVEACERLGIPYGIYLYAYATNTTRAAGEAAHALRLAEGRQLSLPIYYDIEEKGISGVAQSIMSTFGLKIESNGYWVGLYTGEYYYNTYMSNTTRYTKWIARYNSNNGKQGTKPNVSDVAIWQYSSKGKVSGISGNVDVNVMYGDDLLKSITGKDYLGAAKKVWAGEYGTNEERVEKLTAEGYDPRIVQHFVNRMV